MNRHMLGDCQSAGNYTYDPKYLLLHLRPAMSSPARGGSADGILCGGYGRQSQSISIPYASLATSMGNPDYSTSVLSCSSVRNLPLCTTRQLLSPKSCANCVSLRRTAAPPHCAGASSPQRRPSHPRPRTSRCALLNDKAASLWNWTLWNRHGANERRPVARVGSPPTCRVRIKPAHWPLPTSWKLMRRFLKTNWSYRFCLRGSRWSGGSAKN
jgi:hypothetical protein